MSIQDKFTEIYQTYIHREGADKFLDYLTNKSDFFTAPASTRYHGAYAGGLAEHSVNVYECLRAYLERPRVQELYGMEYSDESIALVSLLHDVCKIGCYKSGTRNVKDENGVWQKVPALWTWGEIGVYPVGVYAAEPGGSLRHPVSHGFFRNGGQEYRGESPGEVPTGLCLVSGRHGGILFPGR